MKEFFAKLGPDGQQRVIKLAVLVTTMIVWSAIYQHIPLMVRVFVFPI